MTTAEKIKQLRLQKGLSQEALGSLIGVKKAAINKYETGRVVNIKRTTLKRLADALGVTPADLLDDEASSSSVHQAASDMDPSEDRLLSLYRDLNNEGKDKLLGYAEDLQASGRYKKGHEHGEKAI